MSQFTLNARVFFGPDAKAGAAEFLLGRGIRKLLWLVDGHLEKEPALAEFLREMEKAGFYSEGVRAVSVGREPTYDDVDSLAEDIRPEAAAAQAIVAVGGGSLMDLAKGAALLLKNPGKGLDYRGMDKVGIPGLPVVACPTTAGTGSEITPTASFTDDKARVKLGINGRNVAPLCGVLIPELTFSCPPKATLYAGLDAMVHSLEAVCAKNATPISADLGSRAFSLLYGHFPKVLESPRDRGAREGMLLGACMAAMAMVNAGGGPASGISYPLGVHYGVPHGLAGGIFLSPVISFNVEKGYGGFGAIYDLLPDRDPALRGESKSLDFLKKTGALFSRLGVPGTLPEAGFDRCDLALLSKLTLEQRKANLEANPVPFGAEDLDQMLKKVLAGGRP